MFPLPQSEIKDFCQLPRQREPYETVAIKIKFLMVQYTTW